MDARRDAAAQKKPHKAFLFAQARSTRTIPAITRSSRLMDEFAQHMNDDHRREDRVSATRPDRCGIATRSCTAATSPGSLPTAEYEPADGRKPLQASASLFRSILRACSCARREEHGYFEHDEDVKKEMPKTYDRITTHRRRPIVRTSGRTPSMRLQPRHGLLRQAWEDDANDPFSV